MNSLKNLKVKEEQLEQMEEGFRKAIENQLDVVEEAASKWGRTLLIAGGAALLVFGVVKLFTSKDEDSESSTQSVTIKTNPDGLVAQKSGFMDSPIVKAIKEQIALFLAALVKQKLMEVLEQINSMDTEEVAENNQG